MKKTFCDICSKEIEYDDNIWINNIPYTLIYFDKNKQQELEINSPNLNICGDCIKPHTIKYMNSLYDLEKKYKIDIINIVNEWIKSRGKK